MKAVILAGGKAARLRPYTTNFPKPLMPIGERPILEIVIKRLKEYGIQDIIVSTGHLAELIKVFFNDGSKYGVKITYSKEEEPLGTAGPLSLVRDYLNEPFILMNGDVLTDIDFSKLFSFHRGIKSQATISLAKRIFPIDFGVINIDRRSQFQEWQEKPSFEFLISTGIYLFEPETLRVLSEKEFLNVPEFIQRLKKENYFIAGYVHPGYWLDIGRPEDYERACKDYEEHKITC
jgi:NDP-mannose synthase